jgi:hypothetical protein
MVMAKWWGEGLWERYGDRLSAFDRYPDDAALLLIPFPLPDPATLPWLTAASGESRGLDSGGVLPDWRYLDDYLARFPDPEAPGLFDTILPRVEEEKKRNRYLLFGWWSLFFERPWGLRGMENLMVDYYENPEEVKRLHAALSRQYVALIRRAKRELEPDGFWTSDDLGNQRQLMMKPEHFRKLLKPYYAEVGSACRETGMHFWLHSCGNNAPILDDLIETGVDVFHPVQKHTMDEIETAKRYGDRLTFLAGFDVQRTLCYASPEEVREEVRQLIDAFDRPDGGMCLAAGNGIVGVTPFENIEAFLDEAARYGAEHRRACS